MQVKLTPCRHKPAVFVIAIQFLRGSGYLSRTPNAESVQVFNRQLQLAVFTLQTYNASSDHFNNSSYIKKGEKRIRIDKLKRLVRLNRRTKRFFSPQDVYSVFFLYENVMKFGLAFKDVLISSHTFS